MRFRWFSVRGQGAAARHVISGATGGQAVFAGAGGRDYVSAAHIDASHAVHSTKMELLYRDLRGAEMAAAAARRRLPASDAALIFGVIFALKQIFAQIFALKQT